MRQDRLLFAFLLSCQLMVDDERLNPDYLKVIPPLWRLAGGGQTVGRSRQAHPNLNWLRLDKWHFFQYLETNFSNLKGDPRLCVDILYCRLHVDFVYYAGLCDDLMESSSFWLMLHDAKEPDNLPLKEPWYSSLSTFFRLVIIATLR